MSSPSLSSRTPKPDLFEDLWRQLGECHQNALQELEEKVNKLKKERCLDAQRLEVFYKRNQQLKEQNKTLQDAVSLFEERLRAGECDRCAILEENLKNSQDQNERLITKLKHERNGLEDENRKLHAELLKLKMTRTPKGLIPRTGRRHHPRLTDPAEFAACGKQTEETKKSRQKQARSLRRDTSTTV